MRRLLGLFLIIRALTPVLAVLVVLWGVGQIAGDFQRALAGPINRLEVAFSGLGTTFEAAQEQFETIKGNIEEVVGRLRAFQVPNFLPNLPLNLNFPRVDIPDLTVAVPGSITVQWSSVSFDVRQVIPRNCGIFDFVCKALGDIITQTVRYPSGISVNTQNWSLVIPDIPAIAIPFPALFNDAKNGLNRLFSGYADIFNIFDGAFASFNDLGESLRRLPESMTGVISQGQQLVSGLQGLAVKWGGLLALVLILVVGLVVISFGVTFVDQFSRGWRLLFGQLVP